MATKEQIKRIYSLGAVCGLLEQGNKHDNLHAFVYQLTLSESVANLTEKQADIVIHQLDQNRKFICSNAEPAAFISSAQIKKIFGQMYELASLSPSAATPKERLCGIMTKELNINVNPQKDVFKGLSERQGATLIETLKRYIRSAKKSAERSTNEFNRTNTN